MIRIYPCPEMLEARIERLPLSKSIAARAVILGALSSSVVDDERLPRCVDTDVLKHAVRRSEGEIDVRESGTALRFLTAYYASTEGADVVLTGSERLCHRPIKPLVDALRLLGGEIEYIEEEGFAPLRIKGKKLDGGEVDVDAHASSQFVSALALVAPTMKKGLKINFGGQIPSMPYLKMTLAMLENRGITAYTEGYSAIIGNGEIKTVDVEAEPDWSAASYWYSIAAVSAGWVTLPGLRSKSLQGDSILKEIGVRFGVLTDFTDEGAELSATPDLYSRLDMDMSDTPDLVPALAVTGCLIGVPYVFTGVGNLQQKECERLSVLQENLRKLGFVTEVGADSFGWEGERMPLLAFPEIDPHGDHRMAMAFAAASYFCPGILIKNPEVVEKSYPGFFEDLADAGFYVCGPDDEVPQEYIAEE